MAAWSRLTGLGEMMARSTGDPGIVIGLLDGPVATDHPGFRSGAVVTIGEMPAASRHGTAVAGVLAARRDSGAPGICPDCTVLAVSLFGGDGLAAGPGELADGLVACVRAGARLVNVSAAFVASALQDRLLRQALDFATAQQAIVIAAAGNDGRVSGSQLLAHAGVVPVASCDDSGIPLRGGNLGRSIGQRGVLAPATPLQTLAPDGGTALFGGTSLAAALVTGALALAWSQAPNTPVERLREALRGAPSARRSITPPLLDAVSLHQAITRSRTETRT